MAHKKEIDFMIIGSQKAGTSSLLYYLSQHPKILVHHTYEFVYFFQDDVYEQGYENAFKHNYKQEGQEDKFLLAKNVMVMYSHEALKRLYEHNPDVKIIIVLRNPVSRAYSSFWYAKTTGREVATTFEEAINKGKTEATNNKYIQQNLQYLEMGEYARYIKTVMEIFPAENVKVIIFEEFIKNLKAGLNEVVTYLNLQSFEFDTTKKVNESRAAKSQFIANITAPGKKSKWTKLIPIKYRNKLRKLLTKHNSKPFVVPPMNEATQEELNLYYKPHNASLSGILNKDVNWNFKK